MTYQQCSCVPSNPQKFKVFTEFGVPISDSLEREYHWLSLGLEFIWVKSAMILGKGNHLGEGTLIWRTPNLSGRQVLYGMGLHGQKWLVEASDWYLLWNPATWDVGTWLYLDGRKLKLWWFCFCSQSLLPSQSLNFLLSCIPPVPQYLVIAFAYTKINHWNPEWPFSSLDSISHVLKVNPPCSPDFCAILPVFCVAAS